MAYLSIIMGFYFAFALVLNDQPQFKHMLIRVNTLFSMLMGEVDLDVLPTSNPNMASLINIKSYFE